MHSSQPVSSVSSTFVNTSQITTSTNISFPLIAQITNAEVQPSTSQNLYLLAVVSEQCSEKFQFNIKREAVNDEFWSEFKKELEQLSFNELFNHFILTSWEPTDSYKHDLKQAHSATASKKEMLSEKDITVLHYDALVKVFLCTNLKLRATALIHTIMDLGGLNSQLDDPKLNNKFEIIMKRDRKIESINSQYYLAFSKVYSRYQTYLKKTDPQKTDADVIALKHQINSLKSGISKYQKEIKNIQRMEKYLLFINRCLINLRLCRKIPSYLIEHSIVKPSLFANIASFKESIQPPEKKRCILPAFTQTTEAEDMDLQYQMITQKLYSSISVSKLSESKNTSTTEVLEDAVQDQNESSYLETLPSTSAVNLHVSDTYKAELNKSNLHNIDEIKFISFLNKMIGKDTYCYRKINIDDDERYKCVAPIEYYDSLIMFSALNAKILLLKMQILISKLVQAETETRNVIQKELQEKFSIFMNNHLIYEKNIATLQDQKVYTRPKDMSIEDMKQDYFSNCKSIKIMNAVLANVSQEYSNIVQHYNKNVLLKHYAEFISSSAIVSGIQSGYSLSHKKINEIIQTVLFDIPSIPTPRSIPESIPESSTSVQNQLAALVFQIDRPPVDNLFWQALRNENLSESELSRCYFRFIFTSWKSSSDEVYQLEKSIKQAIKYNCFDSQLQLNLIEKHFQEGLRYQASQLIYHILQVIKQRKKINSSRLNETETGNIDRRIKISLGKLRNNYRKTLRVHSDYLAARKNPTAISIRKLFDEIKIYQRYIDFHTKIDTEDMRLHALLLDKILKKNESFSYARLLELIDDETCSTSKQVQFVPSLNLNDVGVQVSITPQLHFAPALSPNTETLSAQTSAVLRLEPASAELASTRSSSPSEIIIK